MKRLLWLTIILSLIPASILVVRRVGAEEGRRRVTMVMDEVVLSEQAEYLGQSSFELGLHYQSLGLGGIVLYEDTFESAVAKGRIAVLTGFEAQRLALLNGEEAPDIAPKSTLVTGLEPRALEYILAKNPPTPEQIKLADTNLVRLSRYRSQPAPRRT